MKKYIILLGIVWASVSHAQSYSEVKQVGGIPTIYLNGQPFLVSGWMLGRGADTPFDSIIHQIDVAVTQSFSTIQYGVSWDDSINPDSSTFNWTIIDSIVNYAGNKGLKIILDLQPTMRWHPTWYGTVSGPTTPHPERFVKNQFGEFPVDTLWNLTWYFSNFYHPDFYYYAGEFVKAVVNRYKDNPNLLGWIILQTWTGENNYPSEVLLEEQIFDYSDYSISQYGQTPSLPLGWQSQDLPDDRPEWRDWYSFRIQMKRESYSYFGNLIDSLDPNHIIGVCPHISCFGGWFTPSSALMAIGYDYAWLTGQPWVDFVRSGSPQFCVYSFGLFELYSYYCERALIQVAIQNGKAVINEPTRTTRNSPVGGDFNLEFIPALTALHHIFGSYQTWLYSWKDYEFGGSWLPGRWTPEEVNKIGETRQISELPRPDTLIHPRLAILDFPIEHSFYYSRKIFTSDSLFVIDDYTVLNNMEMLNVFADAGIPYDVLIPDFITSNPSVLNNYLMIVLTLPKERVETYLPELWSILNSYSGAVKDIEDIFSPLMKFYGLYRYWIERDTVFNYLIMPLCDSMDVYDVPRHIYSNYGILIYGFKPYLWCFIPDSVFSYSGEIQFDVTGWNLPQGAINITDKISGAGYAGQVIGEKLVVDMTLLSRNTYLLSVGTPGISETQISLFSSNELNIFPNIIINESLIRYTIAKSCFVKLSIYNSTGQLIKTLVNARMDAGNYCISWNGIDENSKLMPSGVYFIKLKVGKKFSQTEKVLFLR